MVERMRFGCFIPQGWTLDLAGIPVERHWETMVGVGEVAERSGFDSIWVFDHFHTTPVATQEPTYEAWSLMAALAVATDTVRLGQMCTCNGYRPPAYLAHVAASIDVISGGRLEMGIGAGWYEEEFIAHGYEFPSGRVRLAQLEEAVQILKLMWTEEKAYFEGEHYRLEGAICQPKPLQQPHIPIWVAGGGEKVTLRIAARHATYTNFFGSPEVFAHKSEVLRSHCEDVGTDFEAITRSMDTTLVCAPTEAEATERLDEIEARLAPIIGDEEALGRHMALARRVSGPPDKIIERISRYRDVGMSYLNVRFPDAAYDTSGIELFGREVIGNL